jgi:hypothetical protein
MQPDSPHHTTKSACTASRQLLLLLLLLWLFTCVLLADNGDRYYTTTARMATTLPAAPSRKRPRSAQQASRVAWRTAEEFHRVGAALVAAACVTTATANDDNDKDWTIPRALAQVEAWKYRAPRLPHAVEATAALAAVLWGDVQEEASPSANEQPLSDSRGSRIPMMRKQLPSKNSLQLAFAAAIVRAVNGLVDRLQQTRSVATSIAHHAAWLGLPPWLVDIRHEATHNALPTLAVLRLGATTLLDYFSAVYWEPMATSRQRDVHQVYDLLDAYQGRLDEFFWLVTGSGGNGGSHGGNGEGPRQDSLVSNGRHRHGPGVAAPFGTVASRPTLVQDDTPLDWIPLPTAPEETPVLLLPDPPVLPSRLGTNTNMFALLMEAPKRKKAGKNNAKKPKKAKVKAAPAPSRTKAVPPPWSALTALAKPIIRVPLPLPLGWEAVLKHLVWGRPQATDPPNDERLPRGVLFTAPTAVSAQQGYHPLLARLGRETPGLWQALVIHLVDSVLQTAAAAATRSATREASNDKETSGSALTVVTTGVAWVRHLLSRPFVVAVHHAATLPETSAEPAPWELLDESWPLNSLCDRCEEFLVSAAGRPPVNCAVGRSEAAAAAAMETTIHSLAHFLSDLLGSHRVVDHGVAKGDWEAVSMAMAEETPRPSSLPESTATTPASMSLEDLEAMLAGKEHGTPTAKTTTTTMSSAEALTPRSPSPTNTTWVRCTSWDACPIGSLPGHAFC